MRLHRLLIPLLLMLAVAVTACGGSESSPGDAASSSPPQAEASETANRTVTLGPQGNRMKYATTEFPVAPGETVRLVFENTATSPSTQHSVVVLTANDEALFEKVGKASPGPGP